MNSQNVAYETDTFSPEKLLEEVQASWPRCRMTLDELEAAVWNGLSRYSATAVKDALGTERRSNPDDSRPNWKRVFVLLRQHGRPSGQKGRLHCLLNAVRESLRHAGVKGIEQWGDADVFQNHLDAHTHPMTHDTLTHERMEDADGKRAACAADRRRQVADEYREYCDDEGIATPLYLVR